MVATPFARKVIGISAFCAPGWIEIVPGTEAFAESLLLTDTVSGDGPAKGCVPKNAPFESRSPTNTPVVCGLPTLPLTVGGNMAIPDFARMTFPVAELNEEWVAVKATVPLSPRP